MAPPILSRTGPDGRPKKRAFGGWIVEALSVLPHAEGLARHVRLIRLAGRRSGGWNGRLIRQYEADMAELLKAVTEDTMEAAVALAELPLQIRGFGPVKAANYAKAMKRRDELAGGVAGGWCAFESRGGIVAAAAMASLSRNGYSGPRYFGQYLRPRRGLNEQVNTKRSAGRARYQLCQFGAVQGWPGTDPSG